MNKLQLEGCTEISPQDKRSKEKCSRRGSNMGEDLYESDPLNTPESFTLVVLSFARRRGARNKAARHREV